MSTHSDGKIQVAQAFKQACAENYHPKKKPPAPFSLRLSAAEKSHLENLAGNKPLGAYIRQRLLGEKVEKRRYLRKPQIENVQFAALLASLGQSRLSANLNQLAKHANTGTLDVSEQLEQELKDACEAVFAMRNALFTALNIKS